MRAMGKILFDDTLAPNPIAEEAKKRQRQKQEEIRLRREARPERPLLNRDRYPNEYAKWLKWYPSGHGKQPKCWMCREATIFWDEPAHVCEGYKPMYVEHDQDWKDRWEAQREMIREAKRNGTFYDECAEDEPEEDDWEGDEDGRDCEDGDPMWE
jgi:hypothetical protein